MGMIRITASRLGAVAALALLLLPAGSPAAELKLIPMLEVREDYNNNLFSEHSRIQGAHDTITTVSPGLRLTDRTERLDAFLQSWARIMRYRDNDELDETDQDHSGRVRGLITERWSASVDGRYVRDSRVDKDFEEAGTVIGRVRRDRTHYGGSTDFSLTEKAAGSLSYAYDEDRFNDPEYSDSTIQNAGLGLSYDLGSLVEETVVQANAGYALYRYPREDAVGDTCSGGLRKRLSETLSMSGYIGRSLTRTAFDTSSWQLVSIFPIHVRLRGERGQVEGQGDHRPAGPHLPGRVQHRGHQGLPGDQGAERQHRHHEAQGGGPGASQAVHPQADRDLCRGVLPGQGARGAAGRQRH
jgi:hypothetical protein